MNLNIDTRGRAGGSAHLVTRDFGPGIIIAIIILLHSPLSSAQTFELKFTPIRGEGGTALGRVNAAAQDKYGVMWFSDETNNSITRYDGSHMTRYQHDPRVNNSLGGPHPECIQFDSAGIMWIGLYGSGLDRLDLATNTFTHFRHNPDLPTSLSSDVVSVILVDHLGNIWVGTDGGLDLLDPKTGGFIHYRNNPQDPSSLSCNMVRSLFEDREGIIWVGTSYVWALNDEGGLNRFDRATGTFTRYMHDPNNPHSLINNKVRAIMEDSQGTFWVGTAGDGLHTFDKKTGLFERHLFDPTKPYQLSRPPLARADDHITFIKEDAAKKIWIGTFSNGVSRYDPVTHRVTQFRNQSDFPDRSIWWSLPSSDSSFWIGTQEDNVYHVELFIPHVTAVRSPRVNSFFDESPDALWMCTDSGAVRKDLKTGTKQWFLTDPANSNSLGNNSVNSIIKDFRGDLWIATERGLNRYDPRSKTFTRFNHDEKNPKSLVGDWVFKIIPAPDSTMWICTQSGSARLDPRTLEFTTVKSDNADSTNLSNNFFTAISYDKNGATWFGNWVNGGVHRLDPKTGKYKRYLPGSNVLNFYRDRQDTLWVATSHGLFYLQASRDRFAQLDLEQSGVITENFLDLVGDADDNLWLSTQSGIVMINRNRDQVMQLGRSNGVIPGTLVLVGGFKGSDSILRFSGNRGYYEFDPRKIRWTRQTPRISFSSLFIKGQAAMPGVGPLYNHINATERIDLASDQNIFSLSFTAVDFRDPLTRHTFYKLENYDQEWRKYNAEDRVHYFNIPPGHYRFKVRAMSTANGLWAERSIIITIAPPWWRTWWAYCVFGISFVASGYSVHLVQRKRVILAERERAREKELAQAREIEKAYKDLRNTQDQLIQSEKMASLGELTAGIAHEIQNPLNFVNNFSEVNSELIAEMKSEIDKGNLAEVKTIADSINDNEQKIIFHGKRADAIVKGMLQHSRSSSGVKEPTDINALADEYLRLAYHGLRAKDKSFNATMKTDFDPSLGSLNVVSQEMGRVILNLITNAFFAVTDKKKSAFDKATADTSTSSIAYEPTVTVITRKANGKVEIRVKDNGNGIPQKVMDKIFQPFFTTKPSGQGTGLGLSLSYDIVKSHGGELKVQTKEGEGAEFIIVLPG